jgi:hypothetical protein
MSSWAWLGGALAAAAGAYLVAFPAWTGWQARRGRDLNAERYLAWRGRADRRPVDERLTDTERRRLAIGAVLGVFALFCLVGFVTYR